MSELAAMLSQLANVVGAILSEHRRDFDAHLLKYCWSELNEIQETIHGTEEWQGQSGGEGTASCDGMEACGEREDW